MYHNLSIEQITLNDVKRLSKLAKRCYPPHYAYLWFDNGEWYTEAMYTVEKLAAEIADPNVVYFIAAADKTDLGYMKLALDYPLSIGQGFSFGTGSGSQISAPNALYLDRIYLAENAVGKGVGTKLVDLCVEMACKLGKTAVWLAAMDSSRAVEIYEKMGFAECGNWLLDFEKMRPEYRGMVLMVRELSDSEK